MDGMNQNNNNPYEQKNDAYRPQDNSGVQTVQTYNPPEKKSGSGAKIAVGIACALVALVGIGVGVSAYYKGTPSYKVNKGLQNLGKEIVQTQNPLTEKIGMSDLLVMMQEEGSHVEAKLNVPVEVPMFGRTTIGFDTDLYQDVHGKELSADTGISVMNWDFAHLNIYADDEVFCFSIPELLMENMYIENENVVSQYNASIWSGLFSTSDMEDFSINLFPDADESISMRDLRDMSAAMEDLQDDFNALRDGMAIEKMEKGLYRVTFPVKETDRLLKHLMENSAELYSGEEFLQELKEYKKLIASDISLLFEIDGRNRIESIALEHPFEVLDGKASFGGEIFFMGDARSIDKIQGKIVINGVNGQSGDVLWQIQTTSDDTVYRMDMDLKWMEEEETIGKMKFVVDCDAVNGEFKITFSTKDEKDDMEFVLEGSVDDIVKGESMEIGLDQAAVSVDGEELINITGDISIEPLTNTVNHSVEPETAFFEMTEDDWMVILYRLNDEYGGILDLLPNSLW